MNFCYLYTALLAGVISASHIIFTARPRNISPVLTSTLHLRCSLQTGELLDAETITEHPPSAKTKQPNVHHVVSIVVYKTNNVTGVNKTIASVTSFDPASVETSHTGEIIVAGNTELSAKGEQGFLEVIRVSPNSQDSGTYVCQVSALNDAKFPVSFTASQHITASEPTVTDIVQYVETNNKNIAELKQEIARLTSTIDHQKTPHIQTGLHLCEETKPDTFISFPVPYNSTPQVVTALSGLSKVRDYYNTYLTVTAPVKHVNATGFLISCQSASVSFNVSWIAVGDQM